MTGKYRPANPSQTGRQIETPPVYSHLLPCLTPVLDTIERPHGAMDHMGAIQLQKIEIHQLSAHYFYCTHPSKQG